MKVKQQELAKDEGIKKDAVDLAGKTVMTDEELDARDRGITVEELKALKAKESKVEESQEVVEDKKEPKEEVKADEAETETKVEEKKTEVQEDKKDAKDEKKSKKSEEAADITKSDDVVEKTPDEVPEPSQEEVTETKTEDDETEKSEDAKSVELDARITKIETMLAKIAGSLTKSTDEEEVTEEATEAEVKTEDAPEETPETDKEVEKEVTEEVEEEKSEKAESSETLQKVEQLSSTLEKVQADYTLEKAARAELQKSYNELDGKYNALLKKAKPSRVMTPFAIAKGVQVFSEPEAELAKVEARLKEIDNIKDTNVELYKRDVNLQKEAYKLVKTRREIQEYLLPAKN